MSLRSDPIKRTREHDPRFRAGPRLAQARQTGGRSVQVVAWYIHGRLESGCFAVVTCDVNIRGG